MSTPTRFLANRSVFVVGGGVAGLSSALAARQRGAAVHLAEQAPKLTDIGAGLQISPNGVAVLDALGLGEAARAKGQVLRAVELVDGLSGKRVIRMPIDRGPRPPLAFHRADLIHLLSTAAQEAGVDLETGSAITPADVPEDHLVFAADGIRSSIRQALNGPGEPFFTGQVAWRAVVPAEHSEPEPIARVFMGPGQHLVTYPLRGGSLMNIVAVREAEAWRQSSWSVVGEADELQAVFGRFCPEATELIDRIKETGVWGLFRHPVAEAWHDGQRTALLGDAAHPTLPFLAQGANLALEDAWCLANRLDVLGVEKGLVAYQSARKPRVTRAIKAANQNAKNYHLRHPLMRLSAHTVLRVADQISPGLVSSRFAWLYDYDVTKAVR